MDQSNVTLLVSWTSDRGIYEKEIMSYAIPAFSELLKEVGVGTVFAGIFED